MGKFKVISDGTYAGLELVDVPVELEAHITEVIPYENP